MDSKKIFKVLKIILIILLVVAVLAVAAAVAVFQFVIKPNAKQITTAIEEILYDDEITSGDTQQIVDEAIGNDELLAELGEVADEAVGEENVPKKETKKPKAEYKSQYDYIKDNVEADDYNLGMSFVARVDIKYILSLLKDGLTIPEKRELKAYLKARFTAAEIAEGERLYNKYSYLLK